MDDHDLYGMLKEAGIKDTASKVLKAARSWAKANPHVIAGGAAGGGLAGLGAYLATRPSKKTGRSLDQEDAKALKKEQGRKPKKDEGFLGGMKRISTNTFSDVADLTAKHPGKAALSAIPPGVLLGIQVAKTVKEAAAKKPGKVAERFDTDSTALDTQKMGMADAWGREIAHEVK